MISRVQMMTIKLDDYFKRFTQQNNYLGSENEKALLENLKTEYQKLSDNEKDTVYEYIQTCRLQALTPEEKIIFDKSSNGVIKGAVIGAIAGAAGGAVMGNQAAQYLSAGSFLKSACQAGGAIFGAGVSTSICSFFGSISAPDEQLRVINRKLRPFYLAISITDAGMFMHPGTLRSMAKKSEESYQHQDGLHRRSTAR